MAIGNQYLGAQVTHLDINPLLMTAFLEKKKPIRLGCGFSADFPDKANDA